MHFDSPEARRLSAFLQSISDEDWPVAKRWVARAWDGDIAVRRTLTYVLNGELTVTGWAADGPCVRHFGMMHPTPSMDM